MEITKNWFKTQRWIDFNIIFRLVGQIEEIHDLPNYIIKYKLGDTIYTCGDGFHDSDLKELESMLASHLDEHKNKFMNSLFFGYILKYKMSNKSSESKNDKTKNDEAKVDETDEKFSDSKEKDIKLVMNELNVDRDISIALLKKYNWDIVHAIVYFSEEKEICPQYETGVDRHISETSPRYKTEINKLPDISYLNDQHLEINNEIVELVGMRSNGKADLGRLMDLFLTDLNDTINTID